MSNTTTTTTTIEPGDIWRSLWGHEQTNVDFYEVTRVTKTMVTLTPLATRDVYETDMAGHTVPIVGKYDGKPIRRKIKTGYDGEPYAPIANYSMAPVARPWDGRASYFSTYA